MDGASRFTQRDAVAGMLITGINIIAGLLIGVLQHGMEIGKAVQTYTVLTIGDGLVTVIPALMISISGGMIITRASSENRLGVEFQKQVFGNSAAAVAVGGVLIALAAFPGLPKIPFLFLGAGLGTIALANEKARRDSRAGSAAGPRRKPSRKISTNCCASSRCRLKSASAWFRLSRTARIPRCCAASAESASSWPRSSGSSFPPIRVTDNLSLRAREYSICLKGVEIARFELPQGWNSPSPPRRPTPPPEGRPTKDPAFGVAAWWVPASQADAVRAMGYTVIDPLSVMSTHLAESIKRIAHELFSRQEAKKLLDRVAVENAKVVEDLVPKLLPLATVQRVIQNLLRERVSIRDAVSILEALGEAAPATRNPVLLTDYVRQAIRRVVVKPYLNANGDLPAWFLEPQVERFVESGVEHGESNSSLALAPQRAARSAGTPEPRRRTAGIARGRRSSVPPAGTSCARRSSRRSRNLFFLAHSEVPAGIKVISLGVDSIIMQTKTYFASSVPAALEVARRELGADALSGRIRSPRPPSRGNSGVWK